MVVNMVLAWGKYIWYGIKAPLMAFLLLCGFSLGGFLMSREIGRPSLLDEEMLERAKHYMIEGYKEIENIVPSVAGLSCYLGVSKSTVYEWAKDTPENRLIPIRVMFSDTLDAIQAKQEMLLINGGLSQSFSGTITKLMLANHGYSDKVQTDVTSSDGSMTPKGLDDFYADYGKKET